jgi:serine/threonine-protein kinase
MGLTQKILLFTSLLVVALVATSLAFTTFQADRLARVNIERGLAETRQVWDTFQSDRYKMLKLGIRVLGNDPFFKSLVETKDQASILDTLTERNQEIKADFFIATDPAGLVVARTDRRGAQGEDLSKDPVVTKPLEGEESTTVWRQGDRLYHAVSVPMQTGPDLKGVLIAGYEINEALASNLQKLTHSDIAYLIPGAGGPQVSVSSLGKKEPDLRTALAGPGLPAAGPGAPTSFEIEIGGDRYVGTQVPLKAATRETVGSVLALRSMAEETRAFRDFRKSLVLVSLAVMALALLLAYVGASRITGPVRHLAGLVERARNGSYSGAVTVDTRDEIGVLARTFNRLLADLREKEQLIGFLREGLTGVRKGAPAGSERRSGGDRRAAANPATAQTQMAGQTTMAIDTMPTQVGGPGMPAVPAGGLFANRYEVLGTVGKGGMGVVYRARDQQLDEVVALKVVRSEVMKEDPTLLDRFKQEIKLARRITHRNILRTHDFGETAGTPYISMEYLEGVTLKDLLRSKGALPLGVGLRIAKQMCQGLEAAHQQGVVHRDIKPQNILILPESGDLKILDFGNARVSEMDAAASGLTTAGTVMGTPDYIPPEQAQGNPADFRSDIYSLGVVLFEIFTGRMPFTGDTVMAVVLSHIQKPPPPPRSVNPKIPPDLEAIILRCLEKQPDRRYQSVGDILKDLVEVSVETSAA